MKVIIAGSRGITDPHEVARAVAASGFTITEVVCGFARGVDMLGLDWSREHGIPYRIFPAQWVDRDGSRNLNAGKERNQRMADYADALIAVWDGESPGTKHMMQCMGKIAKPIYYVDLGEL